MSKGKLFDILTLLLLLSILTFSLLRITNEFRWSGWAFGDAQAIFAADHFLNDGFISTYSLPSYQLYSEWSSKIAKGIYTHYPQLVNIPIITGLKSIGINDPFYLKGFHIIISLMALYFWYLFARIIAGKSVAFVSLVFISMSVVFLDYVDSLVQTYDELFRFGCMAFLVLAEERVQGRGWRILFISLAWLFCLLQSLNSYEYIFSLQIFILGYYMVYLKKFNIKKILLFLSAPVLGLALHFTQVILFLGIKGAFQDYYQQLVFRTLGPLLENLSYLDKLRWGINSLRTFRRGIISSYGLDMISFGITVYIFVVAISIISKPDERRLWEKNHKILAILLISGISWYILFLQYNLNFMIYTTKHLFPFLGLSVGLMTHYSLNMAREPGNSPKLSFRVMPLITVLFLIWLPFLLNAGRYLKDYPNILGPRTYPAGNPTENYLRDINICQRIRALSDDSKEGFVFDRNVFSAHTSPGRFPSINAIIGFYCQKNMVSFRNTEDFYLTIYDITKRIREPSVFFAVLSNHDPLIPYLSVSKVYQEPLFDTFQLIKFNPKEFIECYNTYKTKTAKSFPKELPVDIIKSQKEYLLAYWKMDSTDSGIIVSDLVGSNNGILMNGPARVKNGGAGKKPEDYVKFDGLDDYIRVEVTGSKFDFIEGDFTLELWVNWANIFGEQVLLEKFAAPAGPGWSFTKSSENRLVFNGCRYLPCINIELDPLKITENAWNYIVLTRSGCIYEVYLNGVQIGRSINYFPIAKNAKPLLIGRRDSKQGLFFNGQMAEIRLWARALQLKEIRDRFAGNQ